MHKLLFCIAGCTALNMAAGDASPGALVAALGGMLCCTVWQPVMHHLVHWLLHWVACSAALVWQPVKHAVAFHITMVTFK